MGVRRRTGFVAALAVIGCAALGGTAGAAPPSNICTLAGLTKTLVAKTFGAPATTTYVPTDGTNPGRCDMATAKGGAQLFLYGASSGPTLVTGFERSLSKSTRAALPSLGKGSVLLHQAAGAGASAATLVLFTKGEYFVALVAENQYAATSAQLLTLAHVIHSKVH